MKQIGASRRALYTIPAIFFVLVFFAYPIVFSLILSFTDYDAIHKTNFLGLKNYIKFFTSRELLQILGNNLYFLVLGIPLNTIVPLILAVLIYDEIPGHKAFRVIYLFPRVLSVVIVGILFRTLFSYYGPINEILRLVGLKRLAIEWFAEGRTSIPVIVLAKLWISIGINIMIYHAGMASIPPSIYESAELDGFNWFQKLIYITIPMIKSVFEFIIMLSLITMLSSMFGLTYTITSGGPGYESTALEFFIYIKGFQVSELGYASMVAVILFILVMVLTRIFMLLFRGKES